MCPTCADLAITSALISDLSDYANTPGADAEFVDVTAYGLIISLYATGETPLYPPPGHDYPRPIG
ncbi:hypothetical protein [Streptomyces sp. VRA16 Mangrove soil]|uniref:hypothetical protein n=1 Tax=Streptomyces sp. VRA16 Mangrove soil TaxID=2817434 RepID=UPI001AA003B1|nr:hypothetical protein [Streptomyces sp. VRA16 Mangrove soil]MBO1336699.1 hypothetical protein [Streptomyces sp. VRA16 Mangrove soil]